MAVLIHLYFLRGNKTYWKFVGISFLRKIILKNGYGSNIYRQPHNISLCSLWIVIIALIKKRKNTDRRNEAGN